MAKISRKKVIFLVVLFLIVIIPLIWVIWLLNQPWDWPPDPGYEKTEAYTSYIPFPTNHIRPAHSEEPLGELWSEEFRCYEIYYPLEGVPSEVAVYIDRPFGGVLSPRPSGNYYNPENCDALLDYFIPVEAKLVIKANGIDKVLNEKYLLNEKQREGAKALCSRFLKQTDGMTRPHDFSFEFVYARRKATAELVLCLENEEYWMVDIFYEKGQWYWYYFCDVNWRDDYDMGKDYCVPMTEEEAQIMKELVRQYCWVS